MFRRMCSVTSPLDQETSSVTSVLRVGGGQCRAPERHGPGWKEFVSHHRRPDPPELAAVVEPGAIGQVGTTLGDEAVDQLRGEQRGGTDLVPDPVGPDGQLGDKRHAVIGQVVVVLRGPGDNVLHHRSDSAPGGFGNVLGGEPVDGPAHRNPGPDWLTSRPALGHAVEQEGGHDSVVVRSVLFLVLDDPVHGLLGLPATAATGIRPGGRRNSPSSGSGPHGMRDLWGCSIRDADGPLVHCDQGFPSMEPLLGRRGGPRPRSAPQERDRLPRHTPEKRCHGALGTRAAAPGRVRSRPFGTQSDAGL